jgi:hypothetical protein
VSRSSATAAVQEKSRATGHLQIVPAHLADQAAPQGMARLVVDEVYSPAAVDARR